MNIKLSPKHGVNPLLMKCFYCNEESTGVALLGRLIHDAEAPREGVVDLEPCAKCAGLMKQGIIIISVRDGEGDKVMEDKEFYDRQVEHQHGRGSAYLRRNVRPFIPNPYRTGIWSVVTEDAFRRWFNGDATEMACRLRWAVIEDSTLKAAGLYDHLAEACGMPVADEKKDA